MTVFGVFLMFFYCPHRGVHRHSPFFSPAPDSLRSQDECGILAAPLQERCIFHRIPGFRKSSAVSFKNVRRVQTLLFISWSSFLWAFLQCCLSWALGPLQNTRWKYRKIREVKTGINNNGIWERKANTFMDAKPNVLGLHLHLGHLAFPFFQSD